MGIPTHGPDCQTSCYRTTCRDCDEPVFVLTCTCGSCVLFDELGEPWPLHADRCPAVAATDLREEGWTNEEIRDPILREARERGIAVTAPRPTRAPRWEPVEVSPDGRHEVRGSVVSVRHCPDMLGRLGVPPTAVARAMMRGLADTSHLEILLETDGRDHLGRAFRYRFYVTQTPETARVADAGRWIGASLQAHGLPNGGVIWLASAIEMD